MKSLAITELAHRLNGELVGNDQLVIDSLEELSAAGAGQLTFIGAAAYADKWPACGASAALVTRGIELEPGAERALIFVDNADLAMGAALEIFAPPPVEVEPGVHPTAIVHESATLGAEVRVGPFCLIGPGAVVGDGAVLHGHNAVLDAAEVGADCVLWPGATVRERCVVGDGCILHCNCVIGADGFGYRPAQGPDGAPMLQKIPQNGIVRLGRGVEVGANSAIDRAKFSETVVGDGTKIDNLVQIGHNVRIGRMCAISGSTGIAGSVVIGDGVTIGGMAALKDHITIGDGATLTGCSQVMTDVPPGEIWAGSPAREYHKAGREYAVIPKLPDMYKAFRKQQRRT